MVLGCEGDNPNSVVVPLMYSSASAQKASVEQASSEIRRVNALFERCSHGFSRQSCGLVFTSARQPLPE